MKIRRRESHWITYHFKYKEFLEKTGLPPGTNIVSVNREICPDGITITVLEKRE